VRILFVTSRIPGRDYRGDQLRAFQQIMELSKRHQITLIALAPDASRVDPQLEAICEHVILVRHPTHHAILHAARALWTGRPLQVEAYNTTRLREAVKACVAKQPFDLLHVQLVRLGTLLETEVALPTVLDFVDALSVNMLRRSAYDRVPMRWVAQFEGQRLAAYERKVVQRVAAATICSRVDLEAIGHGLPLHQLDNGVELARFPFSLVERSQCEIVFVGNLGYFPNVDAVSWFATMVLPTLANIHPNIRLTLVGVRPHATLKRLAARMPVLNLIGPVLDVHPYLARATLAIAPLRAGSGQQLKALEAMASGAPVVVSSVTAAAMAAVDGHDLLVADGVDATVHAISRLLLDPELRKSLAANARHLIESRYTWAQSAANLERVWQGAVTGSSAAAGLTSFAPREARCLAKQPDRGG
jgi:polysaccharide biosynthesis protein PslH